MTTTPATQPTTSPAPGRPLLDAGDETAEKLYRGKTLSDWAIRIVLVAVMTAALAVGTWSIYTLLTTTFHVPDFIAVLGCGMFDGAALFFALLSQRYATTTDSGLAPRAAMLAMVTASSWVNWQHAQLEHWGTVGGVILAAAPGIAELAFLMFHKFAHRETLRNLGRVPQALPTLGKWAWMAHPFRARKTVDAHIKAALTEHEAVAQRREVLAKDRAKSIITVPRSTTDVTLDRTDRTASALDRSTDRGPQALDRAETNGPSRADRTADRPAITGGPDRGPWTAPEARTADRLDRTEGMDRDPASVRTTGPDRSTLTASRTTSGPDRTDAATTPQADRGPVHELNTNPDHTTRSADHDAADLTLTELERTAIETLRSADRSISKRSISDVIRNDLGGSIASDRAVQIARHFRTLRTAA
ncbi:DUF2637 domain-containing protein [Streptomyces sp. NBC_01221]|uniref:DUF2637 domain-containing protein n=1 Tax=Streptomyces sp. NBC_01221 TaxID=2903782 RepID=UPI002255DABF|nr:DUF2637 domain-containing protein [Streptomyces sp. NBC_01221]MCX4792511.1 DUF2637 domain-containing protein [Streptomyces sp. NBC_01221]